MRKLRNLSSEAITTVVRAARTLNNIGWRITDISNALGLDEDNIKELIKQPENL